MIEWEHKLNIEVSALWGLIINQKEYGLLIVLFVLLQRFKKDHLETRRELNKTKNLCIQVTLDNSKSFNLNTLMLSNLKYSLLEKD